MRDEQDAANLFDKIRADADEKRKARIEEKRKTDEFFIRMKNGANPLDEIKRRMKGEIK
jgi:uncharacterized protein involved in exopolysaccharide biosynthesis